MRLNMKQIRRNKAHRFVVRELRKYGLSYSILYRMTRAERRKLVKLIITPAVPVTDEIIPFKVKMRVKLPLISYTGTMPVYNY